MLTASHPKARAIATDDTSAPTATTAMFASDVGEAEEEGVPKPEENGVEPPPPPPPALEKTWRRETNGRGAGS